MPSVCIIMALQGTPLLDKMENWLVSFRNPLEIFEENPTYLVCELFFLTWGVITLVHACRHGGRYLQVWMAALIHGFVTESLSYVMPEIDSFWHGHSTIIFFNQRFPLHIVVFYPCFHYTTNVLVKRLRLSFWAEPFAVALTDLLLDIPFDIMGIRLIWWTWHDTDPNLFDRTYDVPWTSYLFHLSFACSFTFMLNSTRLLFTGSRDNDAPTSSLWKELSITALTGLLTMAVAVLFQIMPFYNILHDHYDIHSEVCVIVVIGLYITIAWAGDRKRTNTGKQGTPFFSRYFNVLSLVVVAHYLMYIALVLFACHPERLSSTGPHQPIGDCSAHTVYINTITGKALPKQTYLCPTHYNEEYFDFHCLSADGFPPNGSTVYKICGTPYQNHVEHVVVILASCLMGLAVFHQVLAGSGDRKLKRS